jgi:hypothetical protein
MMVKLEEINDRFIGWLERFLKKNRITLPFADSFFNLLISYFLTEEQINKLLKEANVMECLPQVEDSLCSNMLRGEPSEVHLLSKDLCNFLLEKSKLSSTCPNIIYLLHSETGSQYDSIGRINELEEISIQELN